MEFGENNFWLSLGSLILAGASIIASVGMAIATRGFAAGATMAKFVTREEVEKVEARAHSLLMRKDVAEERFRSVTAKLDEMREEVKEGLQRIEDKLDKNEQQQRFPSTRNR